eukprot:911755-Rhodomonas_salina.1
MRGLAVLCLLLAARAAGASMCEDTCSSDGDCLATGSQQTESAVGYYFFNGNMVGFTVTNAPGPATHSIETYTVSALSTNSELKWTSADLYADSAYTVMIWVKMSIASDFLQVISLEQGVRKFWVYKDTGKLR